MARPKKNQEESGSLPATEREMAHETVAVAPEPVYVPAYTPPTPRQMHIERQGQRSEPYTRRFPQIRGGICEFCGVMDRNVASQDQYKLCPHYRGMDARCSYCPEHKDPTEVVRISDLNVAESPNNPNVLIMWCNSYECSKAHRERFIRST